MTIHELIITDVTQYDDLFCVAGFDINSREMIRPEPPTMNPLIERTRFWCRLAAGPGCFFDVGNVVRFEASPAPANSPYPHATEDRLYVHGPNTGFACTGKMAENEIEEVVRNSKGFSQSLSTAFGGALVHNPSTGKAYVPVKTITNSLTAINIVPQLIKFQTDDKGKLRALIKDNIVQYNLSVSADAARRLFSSAGISTLMNYAQSSQFIHVRLGLSRPFGEKKDRCYAQVNGLFFL